MEHRIIFATGNAGKMKEVRMILGDLGIPVLSMKEAGIAADIVENGKSFEENAVIKAEAIRDLTAAGDLVLADDSGLEIDYLDGAPGIYSARFMGEDTSYVIKNTALVEKLAGVPEEKRTARFVCAIACALPDGRTITTRGGMEGLIAPEIRGETGFGYDKANCTLGLIFSVKDPDALVRTQQGFGLHMPLVLGDYVEELKTVADIFGLETVVCL